MIRQSKYWWSGSVLAKNFDYPRIIAKGGRGGTRMMCNSVTSTSREYLEHILHTGDLLPLFPQTLPALSLHKVNLPPILPGRASHINTLVMYFAKYTQPAITCSCRTQLATEEWVPCINVLSDAVC